MNQPTQFDARAQQLHATASTQLSPQTLMRLRAARLAVVNRPVPKVGLFAPRWLAASALSFALLAVVGVGLLRHTEHSPSSATEVAGQAVMQDQEVMLALEDSVDDPFDELDASPDLFVWLGSNSQPLAME